MHVRYLATTATITTSRMEEGRPFGTPASSNTTLVRAQGASTACLEFSQNTASCAATRTTLTKWSSSIHTITFGVRKKAGWQLVIRCSSIISTRIRPQASLKRSASKLTIGTTSTQAAWTRRSISMISVLLMKLNKSGLPPPLAAGLVTVRTTCQLSTMTLNPELRSPVVTSSGTRLVRKTTSARKVLSWCGRAWLKISRSWYVHPARR